MPLYEYTCESCGRNLEAFQSFSEAPLSVCERCGGRLKRLISPPALQFKGSGWYVSDYGRSGGPRGTSDPGKPEGEGARGAASPAAASGDSASKDSANGTSSKKNS